MGCSASKGLTRKRTARESWYAPITRSASAPINYVADVEADICYSPSTPYSITDDKTPFGKSNKNSLASMLQEENLAFEESQGNHTTENGIHDSCVYHVRDNFVYTCEPRKRIAVSRAYSRYNSTLNPVAEVSECDNGDVDTINTWEPMKGLDEDDSRRKPPPMRSTGKRGAFEKSQSFNKVHGLDSCFTELSSPVWQRYFSEQGKDDGKELEFFEKHISSEENTFKKHTESNSTSPAKSPLKSPLRTPVQSPLRSPWKSPLRSPLMGSNSPLFDPSLLAKFEQAVDASVLPQDDWFTRNKNEGSMTTSSSSFYNHTWGLSETTSSDGESPQSTLKEKADMLPMNVITLCELENYDIRCPPKGEDKVVLYFTSLRGVRKTYEDCCVLRRIFQGLGIHVDERDVWMHFKFREELTELLDNKRVQVPRLFIKGRYIGGVEEICQLHEDGFLEGLIEGMPCFGTFRKACEGCAGMRFVPCLTCHGSCKLLDDLDQVMRCSECNENGLILCPLCS